MRVSGIRVCSGKEKKIVHRPYFTLIIDKDCTNWFC